VTLRTILTGPDGAQAGETQTSGPVQAGGSFEFVQEIPVSEPRLWSPDTPELYHIESRVELDGQLVDSSMTTFGIRSLAFSAEGGFLLNGQPLLMKGGCVHHDNGVLGAASYPRAEERKVALHKASGFNAIRCAHNPPAPAFLDACDRLGMLVIDESFDCWREGKNPHDYHVAFDDWWERDIEAMVLRDRNHPSVVVWSIGNEVLERDGRSNGAGIARMLAEKVRALDPTRPLTAAICGVWDGHRTWEDTDAVFAVLDIGGYNYQWRQYEPDHRRHPERIMFGTESFPLEAFENWASVVENSYVIGDFVWTSLDYLGESGIGRVHFDEKAGFLGEYPWHQAYCGDIDLAGFKRPQSYYRDIVWGSGAKLYIAVHAPSPEGKQPHITQWGWPDVRASWTWPGSESKTFKVEVYSACEQVELFLNGRSLGTKASGRDERQIATFQVPYEPGDLRAVGSIGGEPAAETFLQTCGEPAGLRLYPESDTIQAEGDLCYVSVEIVDEAGRLQPNANNTLYFTLQGAGEIAAVGTGNPTSTERYRGNQRDAFRGRCLVVLKTNGQTGTIHLRANADGLTGADVAIQVV
jgi:beta-galactosidase